jgi:prevent-host-death family protein
MPQQVEQNVKPTSELKQAIKDRYGYGETKTIAAGEFKAKCLKLLDEVAETREPLIVTKFGKPVARLVPIHPEKFDIIGAMRGSVLWEGDIISPIDVEWDAMQ